MWHPIFDSGRWQEPVVCQQVWPTDFGRANNGGCDWESQGLPMIQSCETLLRVKVISLGIFWIQSSGWVSWYSVALFCSYSVFWVHLFLSAAERQTWESSSYFDWNVPFPRLNVVYSIQTVNLWKWGGLAAYWSGLSTKYVSGSKMWIYGVWGQTASRQLELGHYAALPSSLPWISGPASRLDESLILKQTRDRIVIFFLPTVIIPTAPHNRASANAASGLPVKSPGWRSTKIQSCIWIQPLEMCHCCTPPPEGASAGQTPPWSCCWGCGARPYQHAHERHCSGRLCSGSGVKRPRICWTC